MFCLPSGDIHLSQQFVTVSEILETFVILQAMLLPIKLPAASAVF